MHSLRLGLFAILPILSMLLSSCTPATTLEPAEVVERYLRAKVASDRQIMQRYLCDSMEAQLEDEAMAFFGTSAQVLSLNCTRVDQEDVVMCQGRISALYGAESLIIEPGSYHVVQEDGLWKWCGEMQDP